MRRLTYLFLMILFLTASAGGQETEQNVYTAQMGTDGIQRVEVVAGEYFFMPSRIILKVNVPVEMTISKKSRIVPHNITIEGPDAGMDIKEDIGSDPKVIKFTPIKAGIYPIYCNKKLLFIKSHRERGMEGTIEVVE